MWQAIVRIKTIDLLYKAEGTVKPVKPPYNGQPIRRKSPYNGK